MKPIVTMLIIASIAFFYMFSPSTKPDVPFWPTMTIMAVVLAGTSLLLQREQLARDYAFQKQDVRTGLLAAAFLYVVFWVGHLVSTQILPFAASQVGSIYDIRAGQNVWILSVLMLFIIGPAEEIFWRGFIQNRLSKKIGLWIGFIVSVALYTLVHIWSFNFMLIAAAALCGVFWGLLYAITGRIWPCIISHAVWDVVIFIVLPIK